MTTIAATWGIDDPLFVALYGTLCVAVLTAIGRVRRQAIGSTRRRVDPLPDIGLLKTAMLNGGPQLAITTALAKLRCDGVLADGPQPRTHVVAGSIDPAAEPLERAVVDVVHARPGISTAALRDALVRSEAIRSIGSELRRVGLLLEERTECTLRRLWWWSALLASLGLARIAADPNSDRVGYLAVIVAGGVGASVWLIRGRTTVTARAREILRAHRATRDDLRRAPRSTDSPMAAALYGGGALWVADPALASTLDVPREQAAHWLHSHRGGSGGAGCGGGGFDFANAGGCGSGGSAGCGGGGGGCGGG